MQSANWVTCTNQQSKQFKQKREDFNFERKGCLYLINKI